MHQDFALLHALRSARVNEIKHAWTERIGGECTAADVPFFLEFVGYEEGGDEKGIGFARKKPEIVAGSMEEFSKPQYGVDILKVEVPINMAFVAGTKSCKGDSAYTRDQAKEHFRRAAAAAKKPFIYLSAGVSNDVFNETLDLAAESGVNFSGVLCGRATWKDAIPVYAKQGVKALEDWLNDQGVKNIENVNARLTAASPGTASTAPPQPPLLAIRRFSPSESASKGTELKSTPRLCALLPFSAVLSVKCPTPLLFPLPFAHRLNFHYNECFSRLPRSACVDPAVASGRFLHLPETPEMEER